MKNLRDRAPEILIGHDAQGIEKLCENNELMFDVGIVFGNRFIRDTGELAQKLWQHTYVSRLVISGGFNEKIQQVESVSIASIITDVFGDDIFLEKEATNIKENVVNSLKVIKSNFCPADVKYVLAIGRNHAARRMLMTLKRWFPENTVFAAAVINEHYLPLYQQVPGFRKKLIEEDQKIHAYLKKGDISQITQHPEIEGLWI